MKLLAFDTCTQACTVALAIDGAISQSHQLAPQQQASLVLPIIDALMADAELRIADLDAIAFGRGPGSFTGVRIGVSLAQGLALGAGIGLVGLSVLQAMAQGCFRVHGDTQVAVSLDARMDEVYFCHYALDDTGLMKAGMEEIVASPSAVAARAGSIIDADWRWAGSGVECHQSLFEQLLSLPAENIRKGCWPHAEDFLALAEHQVKVGNLQDPAEAAPVYLRNKVALTTRERAAIKAQQAP